MLCQKAHEECGSSWHGKLPKETISHIQSAGCLGQKEVVTSSHNAFIRELIQEVNVHWKEDRHLTLLKIKTESRLDKLWDQEECNQFVRRKNFGKKREMKKRKSRGRKRMRGRQYRRNSTKKDSGGEDWMELDWTWQLKSSQPSNSSERKMRESTTWKGQQQLVRNSTRVC